MATSHYSPFVSRISTPLQLTLHTKQGPLSTRAFLKMSPGALQRYEEKTENQLLIALSERVIVPVNPQVYENGFLVSKIKPRWVREYHPEFDISDIQVEFGAPTGSYQINWTSSILDFYLENFLPLLPIQGHYPLDVKKIDLDVRVLSNLSLSVYFGIFIAEMKYRSCADRFTRSIIDKDMSKLAELLKYDEDFTELKKRLSMKEKLPQPTPKLTPKS